jgi:endonuclease III-like uncharacterized protein
VAERTVNVRINYQVNTADVQRATAASQAAQKATDELRKAAQEYGKASTQAHKESAAAARQSANEIASLSKEFSGLYSSIKLVLSAGLAREILDSTLNMATLSGKIEGVSKAFNRIPQAAILMNQLRKATHGTVTDLELMQKALTAQNFRIPLEKLGTLLEFAAAKAQQTGQEVNHLVDYIVTGIGLRSLRRLDDLGFTANRLKGALGDVSLQAADMGEVMSAVATLMQEDLQKTGGFAKTSATEVEILENKWEKLRVTIAKTLTSPAVIKFYQGAVDALNSGVDLLFGNMDDRQREQAKSKAAEDVEAFKAMHSEVLKERQKAIDLVEKEIASRKAMKLLNEDELADLRTRFKELTDNGKRMSVADQEEVDRIKEQAEFYKQKNLMLQESMNILVGYREELEKVTKDESEVAGEYLTFKATVEKLSDEMPVFITPKFSEEDMKKVHEEAYDYMSNQILQGENFNGLTVGDILFGDEEKRKTDWEILQDEFRKNWRGILSQGLDDTAMFLIAIQDAELAAMESKMQRLQEYYSDELQMAGDNEQAKKAIQEKADMELRRMKFALAQKEWQNKRNAVLINTAAGIAQNIAEYPWPTWILPVAVTAAQGAAQLAAVEKSKPRFAKGVLNLKGPGTETSDSIAAYLSKGESVMTAEETRRSFGLLEAIKENKIDDRILKGIDFSGGRQAKQNVDLAPVVNELQAIRKGQYALEEQFGVTYRMYTSTSGNRKKIRAKSMGNY